MDAPSHSGDAGDGMLDQSIHSGQGAGPHATGDVHDMGASDHARGVSISPINLGTIAAFLAWFGGAGYLLTAYSKLWFVWGLGLSVLTGFIGASAVFWFLARVLIGTDRDLNPADYQMTGVLGHISSSIREGGTGEVVYSQEGTRHTCGARSEDGRSIPQGTEVLITRYKKGIAYVRRWDELAREESLDSFEPDSR
jgi:membrane protein implicated in regulation of membrane protease activity